MSVSDEQVAFLRDLFAGLGSVTVRRMFGGAGVYLDDAMFAVVVDGLVWLRADAALAQDLAAAGSEQWIYDGGRKAVAQPYWRLPEAALDEPEAAAALARRALVPAREAAAKRVAEKARRAARKAREPG